MTDQLKLLAGMPIMVENVGRIYPLTLGEIAEMGQNEYDIKVSILLVNKNIIEIPNNENLNNFSFAMLYCAYNNDFKKLFLNSLSLFFRETVNLQMTSKENGFLYIENFERRIDESNFDLVQNIIKEQNCIKKDMSEEYNPADEATERLLKRREELRKKISEIKNKDNNNDPLTLSDLVSILSSRGNGIDIFNVWDLSMYAFNDQFNRMKMFDDYDVNIRSILAGADPNKIDLKHWMSKIEK